MDFIMVYLTVILASEVLEWLLSNGWKVYGEDQLTYF
jgi:hypothetical protein